MRFTIRRKKTNPARRIKLALTFVRGRSSIWLERRPVTSEVASSRLVDPALENSGFRPLFSFSLGRLAQLVQSAALTRQRSLVRSQ